MKNTNDNEVKQGEKTRLLSDSRDTRSASPVQQRWLPFELLGFAYFFVSLQSTTLAQFYMIDKIAEKYDSFNRSTNSSEDDPCTNAKSSGNLSIQDKIEAEAADYTTFLLICASLPGILQTFVLGALSDRYGRKIAMLFPLCGCLLKYVIFIIVFVLNIPIGYLFLGAAVDGLSGSVGAMFTALNSAMVDITPKGPRRVFRLTLLQAGLNLGFAAGIFSLGPWIEASGYKQPAYVMTGIIGATVIFTLIFLPETRPKCHDSGSFTDHLKHIKTSFTLYLKDTPDHRRWKLIVCLVTFLFAYSVELTKGNILNLFLLGSPFCWGKSQVTTYNAVRVVMNWLCILTFTRLVRRRLQEPTIALIGCVSNVLFLLTMGLADNTALVISAAVVGLLSEVPAPMLRSTVSGLVSSNEQGALFASVSSVELLMSAVIGSFVSQIYKASLSFFSGLIFIILAAMILTTALLLVPLVYNFWKRQKREEKQSQDSPSTASGSDANIVLEDSSEAHSKSC